MIGRQLQRQSLTYLIAICLTATASGARPPGYLKRTVPLNAPPVGLAFDSSGVLYALENASGNSSTIRVIQPDYSFGTDLPVTGDDPNNFFVGGMSYDPVTDSLLITDNTADGRLYSVSKTGVKQTLATGIPAIADVAVRSTGEIFVSTALGDNIGDILQVNRATGATSVAAGGLDFGAGIAFDSADNLIAQDADASTFQGRLQRLPISGTSGNLQFGPWELLLEGMQSGAGLAIDSEGDLFTTGSGGLFSLEGLPLAEVSFEANGNPFQFSTAIDFDPGTKGFEPFVGPGGGRLAWMADFGFQTQDTFVSLLEPLPPPDANFNGDPFIDGLDLNIWLQHFGTASGADQTTGDADGDEDTDNHDFFVWQRQFEEIPSATSQNQIPEPATCILTMGLVPWLWGSRRLRHVESRRESACQRCCDE